MPITACSSCSTRFKVPDEHVGKPMKCPKCGARFRVADEAAGASARKKANTTAIIWVSAVAAILIVAFIAWKKGFGSKAPLEGHIGQLDAEEAAAIERGKANRNSTSTAPSKALTPDEALKKRASDVLVAMRTGDDASLGQWIEYSRFHEAKRAAGSSAPPWAQLPPEEQYVQREALHTELAGTGSAKILIERGAIQSLEITEPGKQKSVVTALLKDPLSDRKQSIAMRFESIAGSWKLIEFTRGTLEGEPGSAAPTGAVEAPKASHRIANPEADPTPVDPVADETGLDRGTIDRSLDVLKDLTATKKSTQARKEIVAVGRPAIPHLLNALIALDFTKPEDLIIAQRLSTALSDITGADFPIAPGGMDGTMLGETRDGNDTNRRRWFGWWRDHKTTFKKREAGSFSDDPDAEDGKKADDPKKDGGGN